MVTELFIVYMVIESLSFVVHYFQSAFSLVISVISNETTISTEMSTSKSTENKLDISSVTTSTPKFMSVVTSPEYNFISDGISFEAFENTLPPLFDSEFSCSVCMFVFLLEKIFPSFM